MRAIEAIGTVAEELGGWMNSALKLFRRGEQIEVISYVAFVALAYGFVLALLLSK
jgi:hypothetical protein